MPSHEFLKKSMHLNNGTQKSSRWSTCTSRGGSKAQLCLHKILQIISKIPPEDDNTSTPLIAKNEHRDTGLDIESSAVIEDKKTDDDDDDDNIGVVNMKVEEGFMGLLIEAAKLISGEFKDDDDGGGGDGDKQRLSSSEDSQKNATVDFCESAVAEASPPPPGVRRSKRGRVQVLPCKYKDSVLEPLTGFSRSRSVMLSNKRRSR